MKRFEIRDRMTCIVAAALNMAAHSESDQSNWLVRKAGYVSPAIFVIHMSDGVGRADPYEWNTRTMQAAHQYIEANWDSLKDGDLIDVEFILGESKAPKVSERYS